MKKEESDSYESDMEALKRNIIATVAKTTDILKLKQCVALLHDKEIPAWYTDAEFLDELHMAEKEEFVTHEELLKDLTEWGYVR